MSSEATEQVVLMLGQPTLPHGHTDDLALRLLSCHLGSGMSSVLFQVLREKFGVAYDVGVHYPTREEWAPFLVHASTSLEKAHLALELLNECWLRLIDKCLTDKELELAKAKFRGQIAHSKQTVGQRAERRVQLRWLKLGGDYDNQSLKKIESITSQELKHVAKNHLTTPIVSLCGPEETIHKLNQNWQS